MTIVLKREEFNEKVLQILNTDPTNVFNKKLVNCMVHFSYQPENKERINIECYEEFKFKNSHV